MLCVLCPLCGFLALPNHFPSKAFFPLETSGPIENRLKKCRNYTHTGHCQPFTSPHLLTSPIQNLFPSTSVTSIHHLPPLSSTHYTPPHLPSSLTSLLQGLCWVGGSWEKEGDQRVTFCGGNGLSKELNQHRWVAPLPLSTRHTQRAQKMSSRWLELESFWSISHIFVPILLATWSQSRGWRHVGVPVENTRRQIIWGFDRKAIEQWVCWALFCGFNRKLQWFAAI